MTPPACMQHANSAVVMSAVIKVTMGYPELVTNSDTLRALSRRCTVQMCRCNAVAALRSGTLICGLCARVAAGTMLLSSRRAAVAAGRAAAGAACSYTGTKQLTKS